MVTVKSCRFTMPSPSPEEEAIYLEWQAQFIRERLLWAAGIALVIIPTFLILNSFFSNTITSVEIRALWSQILITQEIMIFLCILSLRSHYALKVLPGLFVALSWIITLTPLYYSAQRGYQVFDISSWSLIFLGQAVLSPVRWRWHLISQLGTYICFFGIKILNPDLIPLSLLKENSYILFYLYLFWFCVICGTSVYFYEKLQRAEFFALIKLKEEQEKSERLLLNILPASIAARLKHQHLTIADHFDEVSVLFADIVGFTELSSRMSPTNLVEILNQVFSSFDNLVEEHGLEKIKTIGDAYMVVAGLPIPQADHVERIANLALAMQQVLGDITQRHETPLTIRIGIHTGAVVAGVIGIKKFAYDLWGDTVNTASRMESHGVAGAIQVSHQVYEILQYHQGYHFTPRGTVDIKGKGLMLVYLLQSQA